MKAAAQRYVQKMCLKLPIMHEIVNSVMHQSDNLQWYKTVMHEIVNPLLRND